MQAAGVTVFVHWIFLLKLSGGIAELLPLIAMFEAAAARQLPEYRRRTMYKGQATCKLDTIQRQQNAAFVHRIATL